MRPRGRMRGRAACISKTAGIGGSGTPWPSVSTRLWRGSTRARVELILGQTKLHRVVGEGQSFATGEIFVVANEMSFRTVADCFRGLVAAERRGSAGQLAT